MKKPQKKSATAPKKPQSVTPPAPVAQTAAPKAATPAPQAPRIQVFTPAKVVERPKATEEQIRSRAYEIFLKSGQIHGCDQENWLQAERELNRL
jgi:hypothetical protein